MLREKAITFKLEWQRTHTHTSAGSGVGGHCLGEGEGGKTDASVWRGACFTR